MRKQKDDFEVRLMRLMGAEVRRRRETLTISVETVAQLLGCTADAVRKCETGKRRFSIADIYRLALLLDCTTDDLIFGKGPRPQLVPTYQIKLPA